MKTAVAQSRLYTPGDPTLPPALLDVTIGELLSRPERPPSTAALGAAGRAVLDTPWRGCRNGRSRLSSLAAVYLAWLAPPESWAPGGTWAAGGRRLFVWHSPGGELMADLCLPRGSGPPMLDDGVRDVVDHGLKEGQGAREPFLGVRVLALAGPRLSLLVTPAGTKPLTDTELWFEEA